MLAVRSSQDGDKALLKEAEAVVDAEKDMNKLSKDEDAQVSYAEVAVL